MSTINMWVNYVGMQHSYLVSMQLTSIYFAYQQHCLAFQYTSPGISLMLTDKLDVNINVYILFLYVYIIYLAFRELKYDTIRRQSYNWGKKDVSKCFFIFFFFFKVGTNMSPWEVEKSICCQIWMNSKGFY